LLDCSANLPTLRLVDVIPTKRPQSLQRVRFARNAERCTSQRDSVCLSVRPSRGACTTGATGAAAPLPLMYWGSTGADKCPLLRVILHTKSKYTRQRFDNLSCHTFICVHCSRASCIPEAAQQEVSCSHHQSNYRVSTICDVMNSVSDSEDCLKC